VAAAYAPEDLLMQRGVSRRHEAERATHSRWQEQQQWGVPSWRRL
jgi:hypothetical protein